MSGVAYLRGGAHFPAGIVAGGGDTECDVMGQEVILTKRMTTAARTINLPAGTILIAKVLMPDYENPSTTGDYAIDRVTGGANSELSASEAETPIITLYSPFKRLAVDTQYTITPTNSPDGVTHVGFKCILPPKRA
jgi:hypothetical protein